MSKTAPEVDQSLEEGDVDTSVGLVHLEENILDLRAKLTEWSTRVGQRLDMLEVPKPSTLPNMKFNLTLPVFKGKPNENVESWLQRCEGMFSLARTPLESRGLHLKTLAVEDGARTFLDSLSTTSFEELKHELIKRYSPKGQSYVLRTKLLNLHLRANNVESYINEFLDIHGQLGESNPSETIFLFLHGLPEQYRQRILLQEPSSLVEICNALMHIGHTNSAVAPVPMELNSLNPLRCYRCGKPGHKAFTCSTTLNLRPKYPSYPPLNRGSSKGRGRAASFRGKGNGRGRQH